MHIPCTVSIVSRCNNRKNGQGFREGVTTSRKLSLERCGLKNPVRVRVRVRVRARIRVEVMLRIRVRVRVGVGGDE